MKRTWFKNLLALLIGILLSMGLVEMVFRIPALLYQGNRVEANPQAYRILCLGDSSTFGLGASDSDHNYPSLLAEKLNSLSEKTIQVLNLGLPGINSSQALEILEENILTFNPDLLLVNIGVNDVWNWENSRIFEFYEGKRGNTLRYQIYRLLNQLKIVRFLKLIRVQADFDELQQPYVPELDERRISLNDAFLPDLPGQQIALYRTLRANLRRIKKLASQANCQLFFIEYHAPGWRHPENLLQGIYQELDVNLIRTRDRFRKEEQNGALIRSEDGWHPNDQGYALLTELILDGLKQKIALQIDED